MLVQLRRVVYLLLLMQCCLSVCLASAEDVSAEQAVCGKEGIKSVNDSVKEIGVAMNAVTGMKTHLNRVKSSIKSTVEELGHGDIKVKLQVVEKKLEEAKTIVTKTREAVKKAMTSFEWAECVRNTCGSLSGRMEGEEEHLRKSVDDFRRVFPTVTWQSNDIGNLTAGQVLEKMGAAVELCNTFVSGLSTAVTNFMPEAPENVEELLREFLVEAEEKLESAKESFDAEVQVLRSAAKEESKKRCEREMKEVAQQLAEQKRKAQEERERVAKEAKEREEKKRKEVEEKKAREKEEEEKKKAEEEAKRSKEKAERKAKEELEKAKEELEKAKKEKNSDGSSSPALLHSPLLLLLLCVLGSILVC